MRIRNDEGVEVCTNCGVGWLGYSNSPRLCNNCLCPDTYCNLIDDINWMQTGFFGEPLKKEVLADVKMMIDEQIGRTVVPVSWEHICDNQVGAKVIFRTERYSDE
jgi:hypothetical protein